MPRVKYMGTADRRIIPANSHFNNRLEGGLPRDVVFDWSNGHIVDSSKSDGPDAGADLPDGFWKLIVREPGFQDITDDEVAPLGDAERLWRGQGSIEDERWDGEHEPDLPQYSDKFPTNLSPPAVDPDPDNVLPH